MAAEHSHASRFPPLQEELAEKQSAYAGKTKVSYIKTKQDWNAFFKQPANVYIVAFYAEWCPACHAFAPELIKIQTLPKSAQAKIVVGFVECENIDAVWKNAPIEFYPTVFLFKNSLLEPVLSEAVLSPLVSAERLLDQILSAAARQPLVKIIAEPKSLTLLYNPSGMYRPAVATAVANARILQAKGYNVSIQTDPSLVYSPQVLYGQQRLYGPHANELLVRLIQK